MTILWVAAIFYALCAVIVAYAAWRAPLLEWHR